MKSSGDVFLFQNQTDVVYIKSTIVFIETNFLALPVSYGNKPIANIIQDRSSNFLEVYKQLIYCPIVFLFILLMNVTYVIIS